MINEFKVFATWDPEAEVWVASSEDVPGLVTESPSLDGLMEKLSRMIPELLELNDDSHLDHKDVPISLISRSKVALGRCA